MSWLICGSLPHLTREAVAPLLSYPLPGSNLKPSHPLPGTTLEPFFSKYDKSGKGKLHVGDLRALLLDLGEKLTFEDVSSEDFSSPAPNITPRPPPPRARQLQVASLLHVALTYYPTEQACGLNFALRLPFTPRTSFTPRRSLLGE